MKRKRKKKTMVWIWNKLHGATVVFANVSTTHCWSCENHQQYLYFDKKILIVGLNHRVCHYWDWYLSDIKNLRIKISSAFKSYPSGWWYIKMKRELVDIEHECFNGFGKCQDINKEDISVQTGIRLRFSDSDTKRWQNPSPKINPLRFNHPTWFFIGLWLPVSCNNC